MKKFFLALVAVVAMAFAGNAQQAIGLRLNGGQFLGGELSYQRDMGANRLELDLGIDFDNLRHIDLTGIYQWKWNIVDKLDWYAGIGAQARFHNHHDHEGDGGIGLGIGGQIGIQYTLPFPITISVDARPMWQLIGRDAGDWGGAALGIRYNF